MAGLQRSAVSFRRQGSSGLVWDDKFLVGGVVNQQAMSRQEVEAGGDAEAAHQGQRRTEGNQDEVVGKDLRPRTVESIDRSRSNGGGRGCRAGRESPAVEPPSPKVSVCGFCGAFGKPEKTGRRPPNAGKRKM